MVEGHVAYPFIRGEAEGKAPLVPSSAFWMALTSKSAPQSIPQPNPLSVPQLKMDVNARGSIDHLVTLHNFIPNVATTLSVEDKLGLSAKSPGA